MQERHLVFRKWAEFSSCHRSGPGIAKRLRPVICNSRMFRGLRVFFSGLLSRSLIRWYAGMGIVLLELQSERGDDTRVFAGVFVKECGVKIVTISKLEIECADDRCLDG